MRSPPLCTTSSDRGAYTLSIVVIALFSVGDFLRVDLPLRPAKSPKDLRRMPTLCGVSNPQMAKVESRNCLKSPEGASNVASQDTEAALFGPFRPRYSGQIHIRSVA